MLRSSQCTLLWGAADHLGPESPSSSCIQLKMNSCDLGEPITEILSVGVQSARRSASRVDGTFKITEDVIDSVEEPGLFARKEVAHQPGGLEQFQIEGPPGEAGEPERRHAEDRRLCSDGLAVTDEQAR